MNYETTESEKPTNLSKLEIKLKLTVQKIKKIGVSARRLSNSNPESFESKYKKNKIEKSERKEGLFKKLKKIKISEVKQLNKIQNDGN